LVAVCLRLRAAEQELAEESLKADLGEMAGPLIHEVTNLLNNLMLNLMLLEEEAADPSAINVAKIKTRSDHITGLIKEIQDYRRRRSGAAGTVDLNRAVEEAAAILGRDYPGLAAEPVDLRMALDLAPGLPPVRATHADMVRCILFVLKSAVQATRAAELELQVRTARSAAGVQLGLEIPGLQVPVESPMRLFDTLSSLSPGFSFLDLSTSKSIARRFGGVFRAACPANGSLSITLEIPSAPT
jgi:signal transduction histidine kinase